jgi:hypothetical protein
MGHISCWLAYADVVNLLGDNINNLKENTETLIDASKEIGLEVNAEKTVCCCPITRMQDKNNGIKTANRSVENVA